MAIVKSEHMVFDRQPLFIALGIATTACVRAQTGAGYGNFIDFGEQGYHSQDVHEEEEVES